MITGHAALPQVVNLNRTDYSLFTDICMNLSYIIKNVYDNSAIICCTYSTQYCCSSCIICYDNKNIKNTHWHELCSVIALQVAPKFVQFNCHRRYRKHSDWIRFDIILITPSTWWSIVLNEITERTQCTCVFASNFIRVLFSNDKNNCDWKRFQKCLKNLK